MLTQAVEVYLALRRSLGFALVVQGRLLHHYARFADDRSDTHVRTNHVLEWAALAPSPGQRERRLGVVVQFARHVHAEDPAHDIPPQGVFARDAKSRRRSYLYTADELRRLLEAATQLRPPDSLRPHTYYTLLGLLACTGLRISEGLALRLDDVTPDGLVVRQTKFRKSRLVPLHASTVRALAKYLERRCRVSFTEDQLFVSPQGRALPYNTVSSTFRRLTRAVGLRTDDHGREPRLHDLRHTAAVRSLEACPAGRGHVGRHICALSTYLGHAHVADTYWYLQATPSLMKHMADACEALLAGGAP